VIQRFSCSLALSLVLAALGGCGNGPAMMTMNDAGSSDPVLYDDLAPTCTMTCPAGQLLTACVCTPVSFGAGFETVRTACSQIATGRPRTPARDYCVDGATGMPPDIGCMMTPPTHGTPQNVWLYGVVDIFANGGDSNNITVEVFQEGTNGALGTMVGSATASTASPCFEMEDLVDSMGATTGETRRLGFYAIPMVPTETPLIIRTQGDAGLWSPLYTYNFQILNSDVAAIASADATCASAGATDMGFLYRARVLSRNDYMSIPLTAGLASGIRGGHGAIAGEVHDCADVRLEWAQVGITGNPVSKVYFNDIADNPLPAVGRTQGTSLLGLYAGLDIAPGAVDIAAIGFTGGQTVSLGWYHAQVFADSVTVVSLRGIRATQVP
jgi:hypothetical protein